MRSIQLAYQPTGLELATASWLFVENRPRLKRITQGCNIIATLLMVGLLIKLYLAPLAQDLIGLSLCLNWLFLRRPFNRWLLKRRMQHNPILNKTINITLSANGIIWSGTNLQSQQLAWQNIPYVLSTKQGFIAPYQLNRFLWLPIMTVAETSQIKHWLADYQIRVIYL